METDSLYHPVPHLATLALPPFKYLPPFGQKLGTFIYFPFSHYNLQQTGKGLVNDWFFVLSPRVLKASSVFPEHMTFLINSNPHFFLAFLKKEIFFHSLYTVRMRVFVLRCWHSGFYECESCVLAYAIALLYELQFQKVLVSPGNPS